MTNINPENNIATILSNIHKKPVFMCVAGELSGDILGGGLIRALKNSYPDAIYIGIGGPSMIKEGLISIVPLETLSVMGLVEVIKDLPALLKARKDLSLIAQHDNISQNLKAFIGIDAPDFNLRCAQTLKKLQIKGKLPEKFKTIQYVSPSIWVWRESRIHKIKKVIDRVLCLFPFEIAVYKKYEMDAVCVGHRLADEIPLESSQIKAIDQLNVILSQNSNFPLNADKKIIALLPGSRIGEVTRLSSTLINAVLKWRQEKCEEVQVLIPAATSKIKEILINLLETYLEEDKKIFRIIDGHSRTIMQACNVVLLASGTATLEAMLLKKPMIVVYKFSPLTAWIAKKLVKSKYFSLPNILAQESLVPELFQEEVNEEKISEHLNEIIHHPAPIINNFLKLHQSLRNNADSMAAKAIIDIIQ